MRLSHSKFFKYLLCGLTTLSLSTVLLYTDKAEAVFASCDDREASPDLSECLSLPSQLYNGYVDLRTSGFWSADLKNYRFVPGFNANPPLTLLEKWRTWSSNDPRTRINTLPVISFLNVNREEQITYIGYPGIIFKNPLGPLNPVAFDWQSEFKLEQKYIVHDWNTIEPGKEGYNTYSLVGFMPIFMWTDVNFNVDFLPNLESMVSTEIFANGASLYNTMVFSALPVEIDTFPFYDYPDNNAMVLQNYVSPRSMVKSIKVLFSNEDAVPIMRYLPISVGIGKFYNSEESWNIRLPQLRVEHPHRVTNLDRKNLLFNVGYMFYNHQYRQGMGLQDNLIEINNPIIAGIPIMFVYNAEDLEKKREYYPSSKQGIHIKFAPDSMIISLTSLAGRDLYSAIHMSVKSNPFIQLDKVAWKLSPRYFVYGDTLGVRSPGQKSSALVQIDSMNQIMEDVMPYQFRSASAFLADFQNVGTELDQLYRTWIASMWDTTFTNQQRKYMLDKPSYLIRSLDGIVDMEFKNLDFYSYSMNAGGIFMHENNIVKQDRSLIFEQDIDYLSNKLTFVNDRFIMVNPSFYGTAFIQYSPGKLSQAVADNQNWVLSSIDTEVGLVNTAFKAPGPDPKSIGNVYPTQASVPIPYSLDALALMDVYSKNIYFKMSLSSWSFIEDIPIEFRTFTPPGNSFMPGRAFVHIDTNLKREQLTQNKYIFKNTTIRRTPIKLFEGYNTISTARREYLLYWGDDSAIYANYELSLLSQVFDANSIGDAIGSGFRDKKLNLQKTIDNQLSLDNMVEIFVTFGREDNLLDGVTIWDEDRAVVQRHLGVQYMQALFGIDSYMVGHLIKNYYHEAGFTHWLNVAFAPEVSHPGEPPSDMTKDTIGLLKPNYSFLNFLYSRNLSPYSRLRIGDWLNIKGGLATFRMSEQAMFHNGFFRLDKTINKDDPSKSNQRRNYDDAHKVEISAAVTVDRLALTPGTAEYEKQLIDYEDRKFVIGDMYTRALPFHSWGGVFTASGPDIMDLKLKEPVYMVNYNPYTNFMGVGSLVSGVSLHPGMIDDDSWVFGKPTIFDRWIDEGFFDQLSYPRMFLGYDDNDLRLIYESVDIYGDRRDVRMHNIEVENGIYLSSILNAQRFNSFFTLIPSVGMYETRQFTTPDVIGIFLDSVNARVNYSGSGDSFDPYDLRDELYKMAEMVSKETAVVISNDMRKPGSVQYVSVNFEKGSMVRDYSGIAIGHDGHAYSLPGGIMMVDVNLETGSKVLLKRYEIYDANNPNIRISLSDVGVNSRYTNANFLRFYSIQSLSPSAITSEADLANLYSGALKSGAYAFTAREDMKDDYTKDSTRTLYGFTAKDNVHALVRIRNEGAISYYDDGDVGRAVPFNRIMLGVPLFSRATIDQNREHLDLIFADYNDRKLNSDWVFVKASEQDYEIQGTISNTANHFLGTSITRFTNFGSIKMNLDKDFMRNLYLGNKAEYDSVSFVRPYSGQDVIAMTGTTNNKNIVLVSLGGMITYSMKEKSLHAPSEEGGIDNLYEALHFGGKQVFSPYYNQGHLSISETYYSPYENEAWYYDSLKSLTTGDYLDYEAAVSVGLSWYDKARFTEELSKTHDLFLFTNTGNIDGSVRFLVGDRNADSRTPKVISLKFQDDQGLDIFQESSISSLGDRDLVDASFYNSGSVYGNVLFNIISNEDPEIAIRLVSTGSIVGGISMRKQIINNVINPRLRGKVEIFLQASSSSYIHSGSREHVMISGPISLLPIIDNDGESRLRTVLSGVVSGFDLNDPDKKDMVRTFEDLWIGYPKQIFNPDVLYAPIDVRILNYVKWRPMELSAVSSLMQYSSELFPSVPRMELNVGQWGQEKGAVLHFSLSGDRASQGLNQFYKFNVPGGIKLYGDSTLAFVKEDGNKYEDNIFFVSLFSGGDVLQQVQPMDGKKAMVFIGSGINVQGFNMAPDVLPKNLQIMFEVGGIIPQKYGSLQLRSDNFSLTEIIPFVNLSPIGDFKKDLEMDLLRENLVIPLILIGDPNPNMDIPVNMQPQLVNLLEHTGLALRPSIDGDVYYDVTKTLQSLTKNEALVLLVNSAFAAALPEDYKKVRRHLTTLVPASTQFPHITKSQILQGQAKLLPFDPSPFILNHVLESLMIESQEEVMRAFFVTNDRLYFNVQGSRYHWYSNNSQEKYNLLQGLTGREYRGAAQYFWQNVNSYYQLSWKFGFGKIEYVPEMADDSFKAKNDYIVNSLALKAHYEVGENLQTNITGLVLHVLHDKQISANYLYKDELKADYHSLAIGGQIQIQRVMEVVKGRVNIVPEAFINFSYMSTPTYKESGSFSSDTDQKYLYAKEFPTRNHYQMDMGLGFSAQIMDVNIGNNYLSMNLRTAVKSSLFNDEMFNLYANYLRYDEMGIEGYPSSRNFDSDRRDEYQSQLHFLVSRLLRGEAGISLRLQNLENEWTFGFSYGIRWDLQNLSHNVDLQFTMTI